LEHAAAASGRVQVVQYGSTSERRPLLAAFVSSEANIAKLEAYRKANLHAAGLPGGEPGEQKPFVWLSYNIHGNESVSMEAAMQVLYDLAAGKAAGADAWLEEVIVVIDPCENPDGRDRYANWYNQVAHRFGELHTDGLEHQEPWPGGRFNHYLFDLNRDWAWQTQQESRHRIALYQQYMPQIHVDLHEMGINSPYFFGPSAEPFHQALTPWQREFHGLSGQNHAQYFDANGWLYFTKEIFDLFYPSYGDTWPIFNGAIGFTYEQGGSGRAGLAVRTAEGDTLTLADRIAHHYTASLSTIELGYQHRTRLIDEFNRYFQPNADNSGFQSYILKGNGHPGRLKALLQLLDRQQIRYGMAKGGSRKAGGLSGFDYFNNRPGTFSLEEGDVVVSASQPCHRLLRVLFEPNPALSDSMTYDMTAWALPYVYGVEAYATMAKVEAGEPVAWPAPAAAAPEKPAYGYVAAWGDLSNAQFLASALRKGIRVRYAREPFQVKGKRYEAGSLLLLRGDNRYRKNFDREVAELANAHGQALQEVASGLVEAGKDFGSESVSLIAPPKVAVVGGDGVSPTSYGEVWFYFEQQLGYPITSLPSGSLSWADLRRYDVLVLPDGGYDAYKALLLDFVQEGGRIIAYDGAVLLFEQGNTQLAMALAQQEKPKVPGGKALLKSYGSRERDRISEGVEGSIFRVTLDPTHPLAFGMPSSFFLAKRNRRVYPYMGDGGWNVGVYGADSHIAGFVGAKLKPKIAESLAIGMEQMGGGEVVYFPDSPTYRGFWHVGLCMMANAVFFR
jgi:hypothetical protein